MSGVDLASIDGIDTSTAPKIIAEIGIDMSRWKTIKHFASWLGLCPGTKVSGGKVLCSATKPVANKAAAALRMAACALFNSKSALGAYLRRQWARLGAPKALHPNWLDSSIPCSNLGASMSISARITTKSDIAHGLSRA